MATGRFSLHFRRRQPENVAMLLVASFILGGCSKQYPTMIIRNHAGDSGEFRDISPVWSHNGSKIAFVRAYSSGTQQLMVTSADLTNINALNLPEVVSPDREYSSDLRRYNCPNTIAWSPDDRYIAHERLRSFKLDSGETLPGSDLWQINVASGSESKLAAHTKKDFDPVCYFRYPSWSPNGKYLSFTAEGMNWQRFIYVKPLAPLADATVTPRFDEYSESDWPVWANSASNAKLYFRQSIIFPLVAPSVETIRYLEPGRAEIASAGESLRLKSKAQYAQGRLVGKAIQLRISHITPSLNDKLLAYSIANDPTNFNSYSVWICESGSTNPIRVTPLTTSGYLAPVWIDDSSLGAVRVSGKSCDAVILNRFTHKSKFVCALPTADLSWSPDRSRIICAREQLQTDQSVPHLMVIGTGVKIK